MEKKKEDIFKALSAKAVQRLKDKKVTKYETLYVPSIDPEHQDPEPESIRKLWNARRLMISKIRTHLISIVFIWQLLSLI